MALFQTWLSAAGPRPARPSELPLRWERRVPRGWHRSEHVTSRREISLLGSRDLLVGFT